MALAMKAKKIADWKIKEVEELAQRLSETKTFIVASIEGFPADKLGEIRKRLRGKAEVRVVRNTLFQLAAKKAGIEIGELERTLTGPNAFIITDKNPFEVSIDISKFKLKRFARPGDKADEEIVIPAGDTGMQAGPILSTFGKLKVQTRVQEGRVFVVKDAVIARPGDPIPIDALAILQKLGVQPVYIQLKMKGAYQDGVVIDAEQLKIDLDSYRNEVAVAGRNSATLASEIALPIPEVLKASITKAFQRATAVSAEAGFVTPETAQAVFSRAVAKATALALAISGSVNLGVVPAQQAAPQQEAKKEKEEEKKGPSEEELAEGLSSLFG
ncbi:50S ribosomal protein L10 [Sulfodiicoccus acidiphilus]|uniref:Large ribosomal subunit protein uL10 n=1 Tax=Sulfodiicoccus acidiphilus TaxID=1670455 RepID=A0A348B308_9CREN|nr:50S ribosomal protein L10 [Sulfodiicoccus acidiphilus]BBD72560.1 50S ribosomal protein L10 [Sulfodiicoccus acidiphilus]GGT93653.1 50S ribosomal protein L10 [Sulfodiicoccus acidiphilus]